MGNEELKLDYSVLNNSLLNLNASAGLTPQYNMDIGSIDIFNPGCTTVDLSNIGVFNLPMTIQASNEQMSLLGTNSDGSAESPFAALGMFPQQNWLDISDFSQLYMSTLNNLSSLLSSLNFQNLLTLPQLPVSEESSARETESGTTDSNYNIMLNFILQAEGGAKASDVEGNGELTKKGVRQSTYNTYRKNKGLSTQSVAKMTDAEVKELYETMYYKQSGADKISDKKLALCVFDTAVNMGVGEAKKLYKKCGNDVNKFLELRQKKYDNIARNNPAKRKFSKGWKNRLQNLENYANTYMA